MSDERLNIRITGYEPDEPIAGVQRIAIQTTRGVIPMLLHSADDKARGVVCISGAIGGFDGPAKLYPRLGLMMPRHGISIARINYRLPNDFNECLLDTMAAVTFMKGLGRQRTAVIGHSFGGAVAINAGTLSPTVTTVIALSSQLAGAHVVGDLAPRPLLLAHGTADDILPHRSSELIYEKAGEPRELMLFEDADHRFSGRGDELFALVSEWLRRHLD
ncbi:MAG: alpha/beta hydrolase [Candidatus Binataceae bacterium]|jgi:alpha/beta superfamily hydrolase